MTDRCINGRLFRLKPFPDDPYFEYDVGECPKCGGDGRTFIRYPRALHTDDGTDECSKCGGTGKQKERDDE